MRKLFIILLLSCTAGFSSTIRIAVASNVSYAMDELKTSFMKKYPDVNVLVILGSSGKLSSQILYGAPYGLFLSANMKFPQKIYQAGKALSLPKVYAKGALAYFTLKDIDLSLGAQILTQEKIKNIAIANPKTAPYGEAALEVLEHTDIFFKVKHKLRYADSIASALSYAIKAVDIALVSKSALMSEKMKMYKENKNWKEIDTRLYSEIKQGIVLLKYARKDKNYKLFYDFIFTSQAKNILKKYGYTVK